MEEREFDPDSIPSLAKRQPRPQKEEAPKKRNKKTNNTANLTFLLKDHEAYDDLGIIRRVCFIFDLGQFREPQV